MHCPNCGKMLELKEREFCTGCGADIDGVVETSINRWNKPKSKAGMLPYGTKYISGDVVMSSLVKGLILGAFAGFLILGYFGLYIFAFGRSSSISFGMIGVVPFAILGVVLVSKLPKNTQAILASSFRFIPTQGTLYHIVDFLCTHLPFIKLDSDKDTTGKNKKKNSKK